ncbi:MAG: hypothetical protein ACRELF_00710 [Gemmataceae bacterium]
MWTRWPLLLGGCCVFLSGCWDNDKTSATTVANTSEVTLPFHARLLEIAARYPEYGRVDDEMRWGVITCDPTPSPSPPKLRVSASMDSQTHGRKLYSIFARISERGCYFAEGKANPVGQVVVKESWIPEEVLDKGQQLESIQRKGLTKDIVDSTKTIEVGDFLMPEAVEYSLVAYARKNGHLYHAAKQGPLFIMFKMAPTTPDTDEGWVYGTTTADGREVLSAGRVESCMNCHSKAPHDRLFGLPQK